MKKKIPFKYSGKKKTVSIRLPTETADFYRAVSKECGWKFSYIIQNILERAAIDYKEMYPDL